MTFSSANEFVHWLLNACDDPEQRAKLSLNHIESYARNIPLEGSKRAAALSASEDVRSYVEAGFSRAEAMAILLNDRAHMMSGFAIEAAKQRREEQDGR